MELSVREYRTEYFEQVFYLLNIVYGTSITKDQLETYYIGDKMKIYVATVGKRVVGCAFLEIKNDYIRTYRYGYVTYVAVAPEYRKRGIGRELFINITSAAKELGCSSIELTSANDRNDAHQFYDALGFTKKKTTIFIKEPL